MSVLADRLRGVLGSGPPQGGRHANAEGGPHSYAADVLGGQWCEAAGQRFLVVDRSYPPGHRHGRMAMADALPSSDGAWPRLDLLANAACGRKAIFIDLETTGLAGGAGTYAFLVGCAWFDGGVFRIRQFFLSSFSAERILLDAVAEMAGGADTVITYNGKTFDLPLMETRFIVHRRETPFAGMPHVDMLHPARRLWRKDDESCRLSALEQTLCGHVREGDVPGFEIPARYFHYVRSGDARALDAVFEHNRLDLLSLACVTARAAFLLDEGPEGARGAREALGLGRLYERGGLTSEAHACFVRAAGLDEDDIATRAEALRAHAVLSRRLRRFDDAAAAWRRILELGTCPPGIVREATEALAVHHEHRVRDLSTARTFTLRSLTCQATAARTEALKHRLARLDRKLGGGDPPTVSLF